MIADLSPEEKGFIFRQCRSSLGQGQKQCLEAEGRWDLGSK